MAVLPYIYLGYMFISLYFLSFFLLLFFRNRKTFWKYPKAKKNYSVSFIIPAYNEEKTIVKTIKHIFASDYKNIVEVIVVNDGSTDKTREKVEKLLKKYPRLKLINNKKNLGNAAKSQNVGLKHAKGEIIGIVDADSYIAKDAVRKMMGFFNDPKVGAVTCPSRPINKKKFMERLQAIEYSVISFTRKLLDYVDCIYVTPGTLTLYRKKALKDIGGFDENNMTQDIEATWALTLKGWGRRMCLPTYVETTVPNKFRKWFAQRKRWNIGGLQCINKYKKYFLKKGILGFFIIPLFAISTFLGLVGLSIFVYLTLSRIINQYLLIKFSLVANTAIVTLGEFYFTPSVLNYLGIVLFIFGTLFTLLILLTLREMPQKQKFFNILFFMLIYLSSYPFIMIASIYDLIFGKAKWR